MTNYVDLQRRFQPLTEKELPASEYLVASSEHRIGPAHGWPELLECRRVVLLAEAGSGKTEELKAQCLRLVEDGSFAFFIRLEALNSDLRSCLETVADEARFDAWKEDGSLPGWFFLDAVNELKLTSMRLEEALRHLAKGVDGHLDRLRCIMSCRPSDWRPDHDLNVIQSAIPVPKKACRTQLELSTPGESEEEDPFELEALFESDEKSQAARRAVQCVLMLPMSDAQIRLFSEQFGLEDADAFLDEIATEDAWTFARRPLDLLHLIAVWRHSRRLGTRQEQHETNATVKLTEKDPERRDSDLLSPQRARLGAERLALAQVLTRTRTLRSPEQPLAELMEDSILEPTVILPDWTVAERGALLRRGLFDPATYGRVRFHHPTVQGYLAACRLRSLREARMSTKALFRLLFADLYGMEIVFPSMREIAAWLSLWDGDVRKELMRREPEVLLTLGDPGSLDLSVRSDLVRSFAAAYRDGGWRGLHVPVREIRRIADPSLAPIVRQCWGDGPASPDVREFLLELIWMGPIRDCADLALSVATDFEAIPDHRVVAIQALARCGRHDEVRAIATHMVADTASWPARVIHGVAEDLFPSIIGVDELIALIVQTPEPSGLHLGGFEWHMRAIAGSVAPLSDVAIALRDRLADLVWQERTEPVRPHRASGRFAYLSPALAKLCVRQLTGSPTAPSSGLIHACVIASRFGENVTDVEKSIAGLRAHCRTVGKWREEAFWAELAFVDGIVSGDEGWRRLYHASRDGLTGPLTEADRIWLWAALTDRSRPERRAVTLHAVIDLWRHAGQAEAQLEDIRNRVEDDRNLVALLEQQTAPPPPELTAKWAEEDEASRRQCEEEAEEEKRWRDDEEELCRELRARADEMFSPDNRDATLYRLYAWLRTRPGIGGPPEHWNKGAVAGTFGPDTAERAEAALKAFWRSAPPVLWTAKPPETRNIVTWKTMLGLAAVKIEASTKGWSASLTSREARTAAAFATTELNGLALFVIDLVRSHPREIEEVVGGEVSDELRVGGSYEHLRTLQGLTYSALELQQLCVPRLLAELQSWPSGYADGTGDRWAKHLDAVLQILCVVEDTADRDRIAQQCVDRYTSNPTGSLAFTWLRGLFRFDMVQGNAVLAANLQKDHPKDVDENAVGAFAALLDRHEGLVFGDVEPDERAHALGQLVRLAYTAVRPKDDIVHDGVYSPGVRDHAETVRQRLLEMLFACPGPEAHRVLLELADDDCFASWSDRFRLRVRQRAAEQAEFSPYSSCDILALERGFEIPPNDRDGLFAVLMDRLEDLAHELAHDDFSDRRTICSISEEPEMQRTLARRLRDRANGIYRVTREEQVADGKETDIRLRSSNGEQKAAVEIKIADGRWSLTQLRDALRTQLVGRYLRDATCKAGCLLLTCHDKDKYWIHPETRKRIRFREMIDYLNGESKIVEIEEHHEVRVAVFGLDLTDPRPE